MSAPGRRQRDEATCTERVDSEVGDSGRSTLTYARMNISQDDPITLARSGQRKRSKQIAVSNTRAEPGNNSSGGIGL